jgi:membrane protease YdiL (CAAX protease family)
MGSIDRPRLSEPVYSTIGKATGLGIGGVVLLGIVSAIAGLVFIPLLPNIPAVGLATGFGQLVAFMGFGLGYLRYRGYEWQSVSSYLGIRRPTLKEIGMIILGWITILVLIVIVGFIVQTFLPQPAENEGTQILEDNTDKLGLYAGAVAFMFLIVGPCEEILYRGIVQNRLRERLPAVPAVLIASVIFASVHVVALAGGDPLAMATTVGILFVPAIVLGSIYEYTGNIVVPALLHGLHNSFIVTLLFFAPEMEQESAEFISMVLAVLPV